MHFVRLFTVAALCGAMHLAQADVVVDQSFPYLGNGDSSTAGAVTANDPSDFRRVQSFTVGVEGYLNSIEVFHYSGPDFLSVNILGSLAGTGTLLGSSSLHAQGSTEGSVVFDVRHLNIEARPGKVLGFEVVGFELFGESVSMAMQRNGTGYAGGSDYFLNTPFGFDQLTRNDPWDNYFVSTVDAQALPPLPVPEPAHYAMLIAGLGLIGAAAARRIPTDKN